MPLYLGAVALGSEPRDALIRSELGLMEVKVVLAPRMSVTQFSAFKRAQLVPYLGCCEQVGWSRKQ